MEYMFVGGSLHYQKIPVYSDAYDLYIPVESEHSYVQTHRGTHYYRKPFKVQHYRKVFFGCVQFYIVQKLYLSLKSTEFAEYATAIHNNEPDPFNGAHDETVRAPGRPSPS